MTTLSIITPCLNRAGMIGEALESVRSQSGPGIEHIVVDGGSSDGTLEVVKEFPGVEVISEPDRGLYDAINKGVERSTGEVIGLLNSDDFYFPDALSAVRKRFDEEPELDSVAGGFVVFEEDGEGNRSERTRSEKPDEMALNFPGVLGLNPAINARFFRRSVFERCGPFDLRYPIAADRKFLILAALAGFRDAVIPMPVYQYRWHSGSLTINSGSDSNRQASDETLAIVEAILEEGGLPEPKTGALRDYHTEVSVREAITELYYLRPRPALRFAGRGTRVQAIWPARFAGEFLRACAGRLRR